MICVFINGTYVYTIEQVLKKKGFNVQIKRLARLFNVLLLVFVVWQFELSLKAPDTVTELRDMSGRMASYLLLLSLLFTPAGHLWPSLRVYVPLRRYVGLWAFTMALVHLLVWVSLEFNFDWLLMWQETTDNLFIWMGLIALLLLLPMALTSNRKSSGRLGYRRWQALHSLTYVALPLALGHYLMAQKVATGEPVVLLVVLVLVMIWRFKHAR